MCAVLKLPWQPYPLLERHARSPSACGGHPSAPNFRQHVYFQLLSSLLGYSSILMVSGKGEGAMAWSQVMKDPHMPKFCCTGGSVQGAQGLPIIVHHPGWGRTQTGLLWNNEIYLTFCGKWMRTTLRNWEGVLVGAGLPSLCNGESLKSQPRWVWANHHHCCWAAAKEHGVHSPWWPTSSMGGWSTEKPEYIVGEAQRDTFNASLWKTAATFLSFSLFSEATSSGATSTSWFCSLPHKLQLYATIMVSVWSLHFFLLC